MTARSLSRPKQEVHGRPESDASRTCKNKDTRAGRDEIDDGHLLKELEDEITEAIRVAEKTPPPALETVFTDVYADLPPHLREQMEEFMKSGERRRPEISDKFPL